MPKKEKSSLTLVLRSQATRRGNIDKQDRLVLDIFQRDRTRRLLYLNCRGDRRLSVRPGMRGKLRTLRSKRDILADELIVRMLVDFVTRAIVASMMGIGWD